MNELSAYLPIVFAQDANGGSFWSTFILLAPIVPLFYFLFIRPQQQAEHKRRSMLDTLKKNDKVLTTGGIYATVVSIDATHDKVILRVDDERGGDRKPAKGFAPAVNDEVDLAVAVELVAEQVRQHHDVGRRPTEHLW